MKQGKFIVAALVPLALGGCIARTAVDIVTLPVKAVGAGFDAVTTSQSEADEKRGRAIRKEEEREGREARKREKEERKRAERERDYEPY
jgi:hypothetical protein